MNRRMLKVTIPVLLLILCGLAGQRQAAAGNCGACPNTGTVNISAACVIACSGSYALTADLMVTSASNNGSACNPIGLAGVGICINTGVNNVTIDMGGHTISATGAANDAICGNAASGVTIKNGRIDAGSNGFLEGLQAGNNARIDRLQITGPSMGSNTNNKSMLLGNAGVVVNSVVINSAATGISCGTDCLISHNVVNSAVSATTTGIATSSGGLIEENTVMGNTTGLSLSSRTAYGENILVNTTDHSGGTSMKNNICSGMVNC